MAFNWTCPFCDRPQTVTEKKQSTSTMNFFLADNEIGDFGLRGTAISCSNPECKKVEVSVVVAKEHLKSRSLDFKNIIFSKTLIPENGAKPQPYFIPEPLREDYLEACRIRDLSPKASATLSRRCLQGMIRDFASVSERTLYHEIEKLRELAESGNAPKGVSEDSIESLHHVRSLGNIGAHMEKDINVIIPVEPEEAQILIDLIETLFDEWYVARDKRQARFAALKTTAEEKQMLKKLPKPEISE